MHADLTTYTTCNMICCTRTVADPGEGPGGTPLFLDQTEAHRAKKLFFGDQPFPHPNPPSRRYLKVWIQHCRIQVYANREAKYEKDVSFRCISSCFRWPNFKFSRGSMPPDLPSVLMFHCSVLPKEGLRTRLRTIASPLICVQPHAPY